MTPTIKLYTEYDRLAADNNSFKVNRREMDPEKAVIKENELTERYATLFSDHISTRLDILA